MPTPGVGARAATVLLVLGLTGACAPQLGPGVEGTVDLSEGDLQVIVPDALEFHSEALLEHLLPRALLAHVVGRVLLGLGAFRIGLRLLHGEPCQGLLAPAGRVEREPSLNASIAWE